MNSVVLAPCASPCQAAKMARHRILFVCLGNICRSPMAEGVFRRLVEEEGLAQRFEIDLAGPRLAPRPSTGR